MNTVTPKDFEATVRAFAALDSLNCCLHFDGYKDPKGYGRISRKRVQAAPMLAHRYAYVVARAATIDTIRGQVVMHTCDTPSCVNPLHLKLGTLADNNADMREKARASRTHQPKGERHGNARFKDADILYIRAHYRPRDKVFGGLALAKKFSTTYAMIWGIANKRVWRHI